MKIKLTKDVDEALCVGSVVHDVTRVGDNYEGLWTSRLGSYQVAVPVTHAEPYDPEAEKARLEKKFASVRAKIEENERKRNGKLAR